MTRRSRTGRRNVVRGGLPLALAMMAACSPAQAPQPERSSSGAEALVTHPHSGLQIIEVTVATGEARHTFRTELADTPEAQTAGLMFRRELGAFDAMLFPSPALQTRSFWMKNTPLALDIIFIGPDGRIANIEAGVPYSTERVTSDGPAAAVLEIRGGRAAELGIEAGDAVEYALPG